MIFRVWSSERRTAYAVARSAAGVLALVFLCSNPVPAQESADFFRQNCASCHTIGGGRLTGPDLRNVTQRKDRAWLVRFMLDPRGVIASGDPYAAELMQESRGVIMPSIPGFTPPRAEALLDLIDAESKLEKSRFVGLQLSERAFTPQDIETGRMIFAGNMPLKNGGPSCMACHTVRGLSGFGGGTLAPDLTTVFERYSGRKVLSTWLSAPSTPTMQATFGAKPLEPDEVLTVVAYFQHTLARSPEDPSTLQLSFVLLGLGATLLSLGGIEMIWRRRFRSVRRTLVHSTSSESTHE